jgi:hypothetical protein
MLLTTAMWAALALAGVAFIAWLALRAKRVPTAFEAWQGRGSNRR